MEHHFNVELAEQVSVNAAIIYSNMRFWNETNKANDKHFHDGRYWFYNSISAMCLLHPYIGEKAIRTAIDKLVKKEFIITGNYNDKAYDRTLWYSCTELFEKSFESAATIQKKDIPEAKISYERERLFVDTWNDTGMFKKVRVVGADLLKQIKTRLETFDKVMDSPEVVFFDELKKQSYLNKLSWFKLQYCVRNDVNFEKIINHDHQWQKDKMEQEEKEKDLNETAVSNGDSSGYNC